MRRWNDPGKVPQEFTPTAVTLGTFDGVHRGHQAVLGELVSRARERGLRSVAITFDPHPLQVVRPQSAPVPLATLEHRLELMAATGLDGAVVMPFTAELAAWSPERFVTEVLVGALRAAVVVVGADTRFGHRNTGDVSTLRELGGEHGFEVIVVPDTGSANAPKGRWSSSWIRELVAAGEVARAAEALGRPHRVTGEVVHGDHRGRELGYPTANLAEASVGAVPADGVYAGWLVRPPLGPAATRLPAAISVGTNPTFDGTVRRVEAYALDRDDLELYGEVVAVEFAARLRPTLRFDGVEPLLAQMADDVRQCRSLLSAPAAS